MKFLFIVLISIFIISVYTKAQTDTLVITQKNSQVDKIPVSQIQKIKFENISEVDELTQQTINLSIN